MIIYIPATAVKPAPSSTSLLEISSSPIVESPDLPTTSTTGTKRVALILIPLMGTQIVVSITKQQHCMYMHVLLDGPPSCYRDHYHSFSPSPCVLLSCQSRPNSNYSEEYVCLSALKPHSHFSQPEVMTITHFILSVPMPGPPSFTMIHIEVESRRSVDNLFLHEILKG